MSKQKKSFKQSDSQQPIETSPSLKSHPTLGEAGRHFYVRQLKDMKIKPLVEVFTPSVMIEYAGLCSWTLANAHARSGEPAKISGYLGKSDKFDIAIADFAVAYANQSEVDHEVLINAVRAGKLEVLIEEE